MCPQCVAAHPRCYGLAIASVRIRRVAATIADLSIKLTVDDEIALTVDVEW